MDNWQLQHRRSLAFDEQRHQDVASIGKFDRVVMAPDLDPVTVYRSYGISGPEEE